MPAGDGSFQEGLRCLRDYEGQAMDNNEIEEEEEEASIMEGEAEEWLRKNIREAGIRICTKIYDKLDGVPLVADIEHDPADYDTWDCCDGGWGNKATFVVSCSKTEGEQLLQTYSQCSYAHRALRRARRPPHQQPVHWHRVGPAQVLPRLRLGARGGRDKPPASVFGLRKGL